MKQKPVIWCVNPWIHDFAAYDFWSRPLGLLYLAALLRFHDCDVFYIDCTDRFHPRAAASSGASSDRPQRCGRGPYRKTRIPKPAGLSRLPRNFSRYGIDPEWLADDLRALPRPDLILMTSMMTYWYTGVEETIAWIKKIHPQSPLILGGIYPALWEDHAQKNSAADIVTGRVTEKDLLPLLSEQAGIELVPRCDPGNLDELPLPALDLQNRSEFIPLLTTRGCPFSCPYCASRYLNPKMRRRAPAAVAAEIEYRHRTTALRDFVFYDEALLVDAEQHFIPLAERLIRKNLPLRFHTPNALHVREINRTTAALMKKTGFETIRLGLETTAFEKRAGFDAKVTREEFVRAVACLKEAGFTSRQTAAYLLVGLPGQDPAEVEESIRIVAESGLKPIPAYYSPLPHTALWPAAVACSPYDLEADPLFSNNALMPCRPEGFSWQVQTRLKQMARQQPC